MYEALFEPRGKLWGSVAAGVLLAAGWLMHLVMEPGSAVALAAHVSVWASLGIGLIYGVRQAWAAVREQGFNIDVLMVLGAVFAAWIGHPEEGALLMFLFVLSGALEGLAAARTRREIEALHKLMPTAATVLRGGEWVEAEPESLAVGERVRIGAGELVPTDATVVQGATAINQATLTGESMPRSVEAGDQIYSGTLNEGNPIEAMVLRPVSESSLQKVLDLVTKAREQREPVQRFIDRVSQPYALSVLGVSVLVLVVWRFWFGDSWSDAVYTAITLLIVASPCALVIATPTATLAAIARAARSGVLFKGGQAIERLSAMGSVCFDKTGTLTVGKPRLSQVHPVGWSDGKELLGVACGLEAGSTHPIAAAVREAAEQRGVETIEVENVENVAGRGVSGMYRGVSVRLGSYRHTEELIPVCFRNRVKELLAKVQHRGQIGVVIAMDEGGAGAGGEQGAGGGGGEQGESGAGAAGVLIMSDAVRPGAAELVRELHALNIRPVRMLTGDNKVTAERVASALGIDRWDAEMLPADKVAAVESMKGADGRKVGVIGDGVNDAPALAAADVSMAIGSIGSDAALESADIVLLSDDLKTVPWAVRLARRARRTIVVNFSMALTTIVVMAIAAVVGSRLGWRMPMWVAVLGHEGGTLVVVLNSLRLLMMRGAGQVGQREREEESLGFVGKSGGRAEAATSA